MRAGLPIALKRPDHVEDKDSASCAARTTSI